MAGSQPLDGEATNGDADPAPARPFVMGPRTTPRHGGSIIMAAMIGIAEALGLDPEPSEVTQPAAPASGPDLDLDFGGLDPLD